MNRAPIANLKYHPSKFSYEQKRPDTFNSNTGCLIWILIIMVYEIKNPHIPASSLLQIYFTLTTKERSGRSPVTGAPTKAKVRTRSWPPPTYGWAATICWLLFPGGTTGCYTYPPWISHKICENKKRWKQISTWFLYLCYGFL